MSDEIRKMLRESGIDPDAKRKELETLACAVADAFEAARQRGHFDDDETQLAECLDRLEAATRGSAMRKVLP